MAKYRGTEKQRAYAREKAREYRAALRADPERHAAAKATRAEWARKRYGSDEAYREARNDGERKRRRTQEGKRLAANRHLKHEYGITLAQRDELLVRQRGLCGICRREIAFGTGGWGAHVDHCHETGRVRGILCGGCNTALGRLGDTVESIEAVLAYVKGAKDG